ncbi:MAG TPA: metal ABC transporter permease [Acidimicrobiales bacterium]
MYRFLIQPYDLPFMARALVEVLLLSAVGAVVGVHVLLRRLAFLTEALQHSVFPGIAIAFVLGQSLLLGALVAAVLTVVLLVVLTRRAEVDIDASLALIVAGGLALGVVVVSERAGFTSDLAALLFGRILDVDARQIVETVVVGVVCLAALALLHKELVMRAFDADHAQALGYRLPVLDLVLNLVVALVVVVAVRAVGTVLVVAFIVTPAAAARLVARSVPATMAVAAVLAGVFGWIGLSASYEASVHHGVRLASGASVVAAFTVGFLLVALLAAVRARLVRHAA